MASRADVAFCALPHGASVLCVQALRARGVKVLDLSADFRLRDPDVYARWYGAAHGDTALLGEAVYGLPELCTATRSAGRRSSRCPGATPPRARCRCCRCSRGVA